MQDAHDMVKLGDTVHVRLIGIDDDGKVKLSMLSAEDDQKAREQRQQRGGGDRGGRGGGFGGGNRGGFRNGGRGGRNFSDRGGNRGGRNFGSRDDRGNDRTKRIGDAFSQKQFD